MRQRERVGDSLIGFCCWEWSAWRVEMRGMAWVAGRLSGAGMLALMVLLLGTAMGGWAQGSAVAGDYAGTLGTLHLRLHLTVNAGGAMSGTLDSVDQGALGLACADLVRDGERLSFAVPSVSGKWSGTIGKDGGLEGVWDQGAPMPLKFAREAAFVAGKTSAVDGVWLGTIDAGGQTLRVQLTLVSDQDGKEHGTADSLDQGAMGLACDKVVFADGKLSYTVPVVGGSWSGTLSSDGKTLTGEWTQGGAIPLSMTRQAAAVPGTAAAPPAPPAPPKFDVAIEKVRVEDLPGVMDKDMAAMLAEGGLEPGVGVTIGVVQHGVRRVWTYGAGKTDSIYEIGSVTKTFTGLMLAQMVEEKRVRLEEPVRELLPAGTVVKPDGEEITLLDLATQHSGLPRMPDNFHPKDEENPYADYGVKELYAFLAKQGLGRGKDAGFLYSNLGFGLLGQALANREGIAWPELLRDQVTGPLGLEDTQVELSAEQRGRFLAGHTAGGKVAHAWDLVALDGAGAIRSSAADMLTYLEANLRPAMVKVRPGFGGAGTMVAALELQHELRAGATITPRMQTSIALAWLYDVGEGTYWHNGMTGGYSAYVWFSPLEDTAGVVLLNEAAGLTDRLGEHLRARLRGDRAVSLGK